MSQNRKKSNKIKKEWLKKVSEEVSKEILEERRAILERLSELKYNFLQEGFSPSIINSIINELRKNVEQEGILELGDLETFIINTLRNNGGVMSLDNLKEKVRKIENRVKKGKFDKAIKKLIAKNILFLKNNVVFLRSPADTIKAQQVLSLLRKRRKMSLEELLMLTNLDRDIMMVILDILEKKGKVAIKDSIIYLIE
ncbi:MAG: hypothetical protein ACTSVA_06595 [Candidatus Njordarchaeales archaeon]